MKKLLIASAAILTLLGAAACSGNYDQTPTKQGPNGGGA